MEQIWIGIAIGNCIGYTIGLLDRMKETKKWKKRAELWEKAYDVLLEQQKQNETTTSQEKEQYPKERWTNTKKNYSP